MEQVTRFAGRFQLSQAVSSKAAELYRLAEVKGMLGVRGVSSAGLALVCLEISSGQLGETFDKVTATTLLLLHLLSDSHPHTVVLMGWLCLLFFKFSGFLNLVCKEESVSKSYFYLIPLPPPPPPPPPPLLPPPPPPQSQAQKMSGLTQRAYTSVIQRVGKILNLSTALSLREMAVKFGALEAEQLALDTLKKLVSGSPFL